MLIEPTDTTPRVRVDAATGRIEITGKSSPERSIDFYFPLIGKIESLLQNAASPVSLHLALEYFNTSSSKCLLDLMKVFKRLSRTGVKVEVFWYYEEDDDDMKEAGEDYAEITGLSFRMVALSEKEFYRMVFGAARTIATLHGMAARATAW